ncbi:hypothetical protein ACEWY4_007089 [Coilia grayii]|uniref:Uncharacterized protein n=1 Tax=Coilia grayii TaxID=363190 RepID=A0ABD1KFD0_9TELE
MDMLPSLSKDDLRDLFPGPEHFFRRKTIWRLNHNDNEPSRPGVSSESVALPRPPPSPIPLLSSSPFSSPVSIPPESPTPQHVMQLVSPKYAVYSDTELEQARTTFLDKLKAGEGGDYTLSKDLRCRLIRNTVTSMITIRRAAGDGFRYPCSREITMMAKCLVEYYPMLEDRSGTGAVWEIVKKQLLKRLQNVTTPKKKQGPTPSRKRRRSLNFHHSQETAMGETAMGETNETPCPDLNVEELPPSTPEVEKLTDSTESQQLMARHYRTLQEMYKAKGKPNGNDVYQILNLEFPARRAFIVQVVREQDRAAKVIEAYPCFREVDHLMDELCRILGNGNTVANLKNQWGTFCEKAQYYGVFKKAMKPSLNKVKQGVAFIKALPSMFPSPVPPPKKLHNASETVLHVLESGDPNMYLQKRPITSPVCIIVNNTCILAVGPTPLLTFPIEDINNCVLYIMACYYTFHLTYPKCIATLLSVLQTEVLKDKIHEQDLTPSYKKAMLEFSSFIAD